MTDELKQFAREKAERIKLEFLKIGSESFPDMTSLYYAIDSGKTHLVEVSLGDLEERLEELKESILTKSYLISN